MRSSPPPSSQQFNNADSFAQAFDEAWRHLGRQQGEQAMVRSERLTAVLELVRDHPFFQAQPELAHQVAAFRLRLLGL
jgi:hypothetical protein